MNKILYSPTQGTEYLLDLDIQGTELLISLAGRVEELEYQIKELRRMLLRDQSLRVTVNDT